MYQPVEQYRAIMALLFFKPFPNKPWFLRVCSTSLLKTLWEKEKLHVTSNFSFSHSVFYPFGELSAISIEFKIVVCKLFQIGRVSNLSFGKGLNYQLITFLEKIVFVYFLIPFFFFFFKKQNNYSILFISFVLL